tara:strand:- start:344 stop:616 length:273 start_codon:yes stop_codon:yes gene_type:complete
MKIFLVKSIIVFFGIFFLFQVTIGSQLESFKDSLDTFSSKEKRDVLKEKIKNEMKKGIEKENYFKEDEKVLISKFLKKIFKELELMENNN